MTAKKPFELLVVSGILTLIGSLGLIDVFFISRLSFWAAATLIFFYGFMHPFTAFLLWTLHGGALKAARAFIAVSFMASLFYFGKLSSMILVLDALLYFYALMSLFRHDIKMVFEED